jgi:hypothetical protein
VNPFRDDDGSRADAPERGDREQLRGAHHQHACGGVSTNGQRGRAEHEVRAGHANDGPARRRPARGRHRRNRRRDRALRERRRRRHVRGHRTDTATGTQGSAPAPELPPRRGHSRERDLRVVVVDLGAVGAAVDAQRQARDGSAADAIHGQGVAKDREGRRYGPSGTHRDRARSGAGARTAPPGEGVARAGRCGEGDWRVDWIELGTVCSAIDTGRHARDRAGADHVHGQHLSRLEGRCDCTRRGHRHDAR